MKNLTFTQSTLDITPEDEALNSELESQAQELTPEELREKEEEVAEMIRQAEAKATK